jgi:hypothetical protein
MTLKMTLALDEQWASNLSTEEILEFIQHSFNTCLGFRGEIRKLRPVNR